MTVPCLRCTSFPLLLIVGLIGCHADAGEPEMMPALTRCMSGMVATACPAQIVLSHRANVAYSAICRR